MLQNVAYDVHGAAFTTEVGGEIGTFDGNIAIGTTGSTTEELDARDNVQDFGFAGDGFWFQGGGVSVVNNISAGNQGDAFVYYTRGLVSNGVVGQFSTANLLDPSIANGASKIAVNMMPIREFNGNVGYASNTGLLVRYNFEVATNVQPGAPTSTIQNSKFWNNNVGISMPYSKNQVLRNLSIVTNAATKPAVAI